MPLCGWFIEEIEMGKYEAVPMSAGTLVYVLVDGLVHTVLVALPDQYYNCRRPRSPCSQMFAVVCSFNLMGSDTALPWDYGIDAWINHRESGPEQGAITTIGGESGALPVLDNNFVPHVLASSNRSLWVHRLVYAVSVLKGEPIPQWVDMQVVKALNLNELLSTYGLG